MLQLLDEHGDRQRVLPRLAAAFLGEQQAVEHGQRLLRRALVGVHQQLDEEPHRAEVDQALGGCGVVRVGDELVGGDQSGLSGLRRNGLLKDLDERVVHAVSPGHRVEALGVGRGGDLAEHDDGAGTRGHLVVGHKDRDDGVQRRRRGNAAPGHLVEREEHDQRGEDLRQRAPGRG
jgi:hypothetical protein